MTCDARAANPDLSIPKTSVDDSILSEYAPQVAPDPNPPPYTLLRFNERYDYLADPRNRRDFFDPLKYMPLDRSDAESYLSLGGEVRERFESTDGVGFGTGKDNLNQSYLLQRVALGADLHANERLRVFAQGLSALQFGQQESAPPTQQNPIDLQQLFADYVFGEPRVEGPRVTARVGRFEMTYGSSRLVSTRNPANVPRKFDGLELIGATGSARLYGFVVRPGQEQKYHFDGENDSTTFWGSYLVLPKGSSLPANIDLYYFGFRQSGAHYVGLTGDELRHSIGTRWSGNLDGLSFDWEPVFQFGKFSDREIMAWTLATDTSYTWISASWRPRLGLKADIATGADGNPTHRIGAFNPLFFKGGYFNDASVLRPTNLMDLHPSLQIVPSPMITAALSSDLLWRYSVKDGVYSTSGNQEVPPGSFGARYIGQTVEATADLKLGRHWVWSLSYVHLFAGSYVGQQGGRDVDFRGSWVSFIW